MTAQILAQGEPKRNSDSQHYVNVFTTCHDTTPASRCQLREIFDTLRTDHFKIQEMREVLLSEGKNAYNERKKTLPAFTPCGTFERRAKDKLEKHNGFVHHDVDELDLNQAAKLKAKLSADPYVAYCFYSPSWGLKLGFVVEPVEDDSRYKVAWEQTAEYLFRKYKVIVDQSGKDICRLCYFSFDPEPYCNFGCKVFEVDYAEVVASEAVATGEFPPVAPPEAESAAKRVIDTVITMLDVSEDGNRHESRLKAGRLLGGAVGAGWIEFADALGHVEEAVERNTATPAKALSVFMEAMEHGANEPLAMTDWNESTRYAEYDQALIERLGLEGVIVANTSPSTDEQCISTATPKATARLFYQRFLAHGHKTLWFHCPDTWRRWDSRVFKEIDEQELRCQVSDFLESCVTRNKDGKVIPFATTPQRETAVIQEIKNICTLSAETQSPCWLEGKGPEPANVVSFQNGHLDVNRYLEEQHSLLPHSPRWYAHHCLPHDYNRNAKCEQWINFLDQIFEGDKQRLVFAQQWFGYCLVADTSLEKFLICFGPPRAGKGVFTTMLSEVLGHHNVATPRLKKLGAEFGLHGLIGKLAALVPDAHLPRGDNSDVLETLKAITGNDNVDIERKHKQSIDNVKLNSRIVISTNELPRFMDNSAALADRAIILPFYNSFRGREDSGLKARLKTEVNGITNWALDGLAILRENGGFLIPDECKKMDAVFRTSLPVAMFYRGPGLHQAHG